MYQYNYLILSRKKKCFLWKLLKIYSEVSTVLNFKCEPRLKFCTLNKDSL